MFRGEYEEILKVHDGSGDGHPISKYPARDPVNIPELRDTITRAKQCQQTNLQEEEKGNEGISMSVRQHKVPYDIQLLILGHLDNSTDIKNAVDEFKWDMTDPYWQRRFPDNFFFFFFFEFSHLVKDEIDWEYLYIRVMSLLDTRYGLRIRRRTIGLLARVKTRFYFLVDEYGT